MLLSHYTTPEDTHFPRGHLHIRYPCSDLISCLVHETLVTCIHTQSRTGRATDWASTHLATLQTANKPCVAVAVLGYVWHCGAPGLPCPPLSFHTGLASRCGFSTSCRGEMNAKAGKMPVSSKGSSRSSDVWSMCFSFARVGKRM